FFAAFTKCCVSSNSMPLSAIELILGICLQSKVTKPSNLHIPFCERQFGARRSQLDVLAGERSRVYSEFTYKPLAALLGSRIESMLQLRLGITRAIGCFGVFYKVFTNRSPSLTQDSRLPAFNFRHLLSGGTHQITSPLQAQP